jgi:hypothetical protein
MSCDVDLRIAENLRLWQQSGAPRRWVECHRGQWNHQDWLDLLADLCRPMCGLLDPDTIGLILEETRQRWQNLLRWQDSPEAYRWVEEHQGQWNHDDWLALLEQLRESDFWPLEPDEVGRALERLKVQWSNLHQWQASGAALAWVAAHQGQWDHEDWLKLLQSLRKSENGPMNAAAIGQVLETTAIQWRALRQWQDSGEPLRWVEAHQGRWDHGDWLALLGSFHWSRLAAVDPMAVGLVLEEVRTQWAQARGGSDSSQIPKDVETQPETWDHQSKVVLLQPCCWFGLGLLQQAA